MKQRNSLATGVVIVLLAGVLLLATGCASAAPASPAPSFPAPPPAPAAPVASTPSPGAPPPNATSQNETTELTLTINAPEDNAIVSTNKVVVQGSTSPDAVVSVNEEILIADSSGNFSATIVLAEGPNIIEIIASDDAGNISESMILVTYEKGG